MKKIFWIVGVLVIIGVLIVRTPTTTIPLQSTQLPSVSFTAFPVWGVFYTFSLKPGGVHSAVEAGLPHGHAEVLAVDTWAFVSYLRHGEIFWTKHLVLLRAGETIFVDGDKIVRGRCGNGVSFLPKAPVEAEDVSTQLDLIEVPVLSSPTVTGFTEPGTAPIYPVSPPSGGDYPPIVIVPFPIINPPVYLPGGGIQPVSVPEPAEVAFIIMALFGLAGAVVRKFKR